MGEPRFPYVHVDVPPEDVDVTSGLLFELGAEGVEERDETTLAKSASAGHVTLVASFASREDAESALRELRERDPKLAPRYEEIVGDAWRDAWKEHFRPFAIAPGIVVRPPWEEHQARAGERVLVLEPGRAFGTGLHETTRLVACALGARAEALAGATVLDVGCGSGILALVAIALGARDAVAIDTDPDAVLVTRENAARNGLSSVIDASTTPLEAVRTIAPVVVANIEARVLVPLAKELAGHVAAGPSGLLVLSGILASQAEEVRTAYVALGLTLDDAPSLGEWVALVLRKRAS
jgi:ribosomal protein L11 methyltransferase